LALFRSGPELERLHLSNQDTSSHPKSRRKGCIFRDIQIFAERSVVVGSIGRVVFIVILLHVNGAEVLVHVPGEDSLVSGKYFESQNGLIEGYVPYFVASSCFRNDCKG
jgi:hypothetical protein